MGNKPSQAGQPSSGSRPHRISRVDLKSTFASFTGYSVEGDRKGIDTTAKLQEDKPKDAEETSSKDDKTTKDSETTAVSMWLCQWLKLVMSVLYSNRLQVFLLVHSQKCQSLFPARFVSPCWN